MEMKDLLHILLLFGVVSHSQCLHDQYILIQEQKSWHEAQAFCQKYYQHLAILHNESDLENFREEMSASSLTSDVWMGLSVDMNSWRWSFQNQNVTFTKWPSSEPNNWGGREECVAFLKSHNVAFWNDAKCSIPLTFVCYDGITNRYIFVTDQMRTWSEAQLFCRQKYTDLATIRNTDEHNQIINQTSGSYYSWIGLFRDSWMWLDGTAVSVTPVTWINKQPDNSGGHEACGHADAEGRTGDKACSLLLPFVCNRVHRRQIVRLKVKSVRNIQNDTLIQTIILQQIQKKLLYYGVAANTSMTWMVQPDGLLFHKNEFLKAERRLIPGRNETCNRGPH